MKKHIRAFLLVTLSFWGSLGISPAIYAKDSCSPQKTVVYLEPFLLNKKEAPKSQALVLHTLIKEHLNLIPHVSTTFQPAPKALTLKGSLTTQAQGPALFKSDLLKDGQSIFHYEGQLDFPQNLNALLVDYVIKTGAALGEKLKEKQILPFLNQSASAESYLFYAEGVRAYHRHEMINAQKAFENAIKNDYNYIPAYVLLSQVLRDLMSPQAEVEWQKAQLLNPDLSKKIRERYLCP